MSERVGVRGDAAFRVEDKPHRIVYVEQNAPVDGQPVSLPDGRTGKLVTLADLESVFTLRVVHADGTDIVDADPVAGYLAPVGAEVWHARTADTNPRAAIWFPSLPSESAPDGDPNKAAADVLAALAEALGEAAPRGWRGLTVDCQALGLRMVVTATVSMVDGTQRHWSPPAMIGQWLHRLRLRDYHPGRGVWFRARFELAPGASLAREVDALTPPCALGGPPPPEDCADELRLFPRNADAIPRWLLDAAVRSKQANRSGYASNLEATGPLELIPLFDAHDADGRPTWYRPVLADEERQAVLDYLESAPVVLSSRGLTRDELTGTDDAVPMAFHTDGRFVWPAAVVYYLREHGVPPALPLVEHLRARRHRLPETVPTIAQDRAAALALGRPWDDSEVEAKANQALGPVESVIVDKRISPRYYSLFAEREGAWCLVRDGDQYRVQWSLDRRGAVLFGDIRQAAAYLAGQLSAGAADLGFEPDEEIPAWQSPPPGRAGRPVERKRRAGRPA